MKNYFLVGEAGSGKDTVAGMLPGYTAISFAAPLKEMAKMLRRFPQYGSLIVIAMLFEISNVFVDVSQYSDIVDEIDSFQRIPETEKDREILQELGTWARSIDPDIWINAAVKKVQSATTPVVITDCRYENEMKVLEGIGMVGVGIDAAINTRIKRLKDRDGNCDVSRFEHPAEREIRNIHPKCPIQLDNNYSIDHLRGQVGYLMMQGGLFDGPSEIGSSNAQLARKVA